MAISDDFTVAPSGAIRYVGPCHAASGAGYYRVIELHRWLNGLAYNASTTATATSLDFLDITSSIPSKRKTDNIVELQGSYNIDDYTAEYLYDGSISQSGGDTIYEGIIVIAPKGTELQLIQNNVLLGNDFWNTIPFGDTIPGINRNDVSQISHRFLVKVRSGGVDIDERKLLGRTLMWGNSYSEFKVTETSRGNNVIAVNYSEDLNNQTAINTVASWTISNSFEGYNPIDVNNDTTTEYYYSKWNIDKPTRTINDFYEQIKFLGGQPRIEDSCDDTGTDFPLGNGTITRQAQSFTVGSLDTHLIKVVASVKRFGSPTGNLVAKIYTHTGTYGSTGTPNVAQVTSVNFDISGLTTAAYCTIKIGFTDHFLFTPSTNYFVSLEYSGGDASNYLLIQGLASTGTHSGNRASYAGSWAAAATDDLNFKIYTSPSLYGMPGAMFRGITHEIDLTGQGATDWLPIEPISWPGGTGQMLAVDDLNASTKMWIQHLTGSLVTDTQTITGVTSGATVTCSGTPIERIVSLPFCGQSTGTSLIGAFGFGLEKTDLTIADQVFDLTGAQILPPNYVTLTVLGLVANEDYILVGPSNAGDLELDQFSLNTTLSANNITSVVVTTAIPIDTPDTGYIRVQNDTGLYKILHYSSWTGSTFTIDSTDGQEDFATTNATAGNNVFIAYIDKIASSTGESFTVVKNTGTRDLYIKVRDGGVVAGTPTKTYITNYTLTISPSQFNTISRTPDY